MRVNFGNENVGTPIKNVCVGIAFLAQGKTTKEKDLYMKISGNSSLVQSKCGCSYAVNLASGQLREFDNDTCVETVLAEVKLLKK